MHEGTLEQAAALIKSGEKAKARQILTALVKRDPCNEFAWLALSYTVEKPEHVIRCLHRVQVINPQNAYARKRLSQFTTPPFVETIAPSPPQPKPVQPRPAQPMPTPPASRPVAADAAVKSKPVPATIESVEEEQQPNDLWLYIGTGAITLAVAALSALMWFSASN